jgi:hypothetical protein
MPLLLLTLLGLAAPGWVENAAYARLFTPARVPAGTYRTYVSARPLDDIVGELQREAPGSFVPQAVVAGEAFGQSGGYNRWQLARLYGSRRTRVARGPRFEAGSGRVVEAWTLVSPHPDLTLERLEPGTLLIVLSLR